MSATRRFKQSPVAGIAANGTLPMSIEADWWVVRECRRVSDSEDVEIEVSVDSTEFAPVEKGDSLANPTPTIRGTQMKELKFKNTTGAAVYVLVVYGLGILPTAARVAITNPALEMSQDTIDALINASELDPIWEDLAENATYLAEDFKAIYIENTGSEDITVTLAGGPKTLAPGGYREWSIENDADWLSDITIETPNTPGAAALILGLKYA